VFVCFVADKSKSSLTLTQSSFVIWFQPVSNASPLTSPAQPDPDMRRQYVDLSFLDLRLRFFALRLASFNVSPSLLPRMRQPFLSLSRGAFAIGLSLTIFLPKHVAVQIVLVRAQALALVALVPQR
jgi:hypothetical protein